MSTGSALGLRRVEGWLPADEQADEVLVLCGGVEEPLVVEAGHERKLSWADRRALRAAAKS